MFDNVITIARAAASSAAAETVYGSMPDDVTVEMLVSLQSDKPQLRKHDEKLLVCVPIRVVDNKVSVWTIWVLDAIPPVTELQSTIAQLRAFSAQFEVARDTKAEPIASDDNPVHIVEETAAGKGRIRSGSMRNMLTNAVVESGLAEGAAAFLVKSATTQRAQTRRRRIKSPELSDQSHIMLTDELRALVAETQSKDTTFRMVTNQDFSDTALDGALLADLAEVQRIAVLTPPFAQGGVAFVAFDPTDEIEGHLRAMQNTYDVSQRRLHRTDRPWVRWLKRGFLVVAVLIFAAYALMSVPMRISTTVVSEPARAVAETLPNEAFLDELTVAVGDMVEQGQIIAHFSAPQLEEQQNDILLQLKIEELTAQTALSEQDYAGFVLSEQNKEAQQERLDQIQSRLAALDIRASIGGRVISTVPPNIIGSFAQLGTDVAIIQPDDVFDVKMLIARVDAPFIERDLTGDVYFRGIADETYSIKVISDLTVVPNLTTQEDDLVAWARVTAADASRLTTGLSGFAKVNVENRPRIMAWSRYVSQWIKEKAWIYLDLRF